MLWSGFQASAGPACEVPLAISARICAHTIKCSDGGTHKGAGDLPQAHAPIPAANDGKVVFAAPVFAPHRRPPEVCQSLASPHSSEIQTSVGATAKRETRSTGTGVNRPCGRRSIPALLRIPSCTASAQPLDWLDPACVIAEHHYRSV